MFASIRARIVALCAAIVVAALAAKAVFNHVVANSYNADAIQTGLRSSQGNHRDVL
jgi:methyl-accepting chemotaxis protein